MDLVLIDRILSLWYQDFPFLHSVIGKIWTIMRRFSDLLLKLKSLPFLRTKRTSHPVGTLVELALEIG